ncbi:phosphonoacetaldehyde hydrolase [Lactiplantibacillus pentosus]|uniref:phosphonoacetaldehyde hydrolase n=1 Tax=Lactiplantibacillus pentosus TaxID=1589 RepID=UPI001330CA62|nr:phosphonoacetaldehyde hydrolase [Lactiplantibacillus pentosus]MBU7489170.1 phosphonoacetaldehyde hydrolase [Lactiplantibacillus pentosus]MDT6965942.1 phosphonoacetaldehyde hydrolase [Lactiplantibacillus pentosus]MDT7000269.1 phosphonoacetaldehyde hydrolase [Lactiplantibacillus pentosus]
MTINAVIFDWAGTTIDYGSRAPIVAFQKAFENVGIQISEAEIRQDMGLDKYTHIHKIMDLPAVQNDWQARFQVLPTEDDCNQIFSDFKAILLSSLTEFGQLKPGMSEVIDYLNTHHISYGTTTGYDAEMLALVLPIAARQGYQPVVNITSEQTDGVGRPAPDMLALAAEQLNIADPTTVMKVGDSVNDILEGNNANAVSVGIIDGSNIMGLSEIAFNALSSAEQAERRAQVTAEYQRAGADYILQSMAELPALIAQINQPVATDH